MSTALLYIASLVPSGRLALLCAASIGVVFVQMSCGARWAVCTYLAASGLALLLCPLKGMVWAYALFFGWYPPVKMFFERKNAAWMRWGGKLACFNLALLAYWLVFGRALLPAQLAGKSGLLIVCAAELGFLIYDYALKELILFYIRKIARRMK